LSKLIRLSIVVSLVFVFFTGWFAGDVANLFFIRHVPTQWAIGIYEGPSPLNLSSGRVHNPVLTAQDVTDARADFVADPFMVQENGTWYMFFEMFNADTDQGDIAYATSTDGRNWTYQQVVLDEPFHMSYPYVFQWQDEWYMLPETNEANEVRLYKAEHFPTGWSYAGTLLNGAFADSCIFYYDDTWWLFTSPVENANYRMRLYYSKDLFGA